MKKNQAQGHRSSRIFRIFFISWMTCMLYIIPYPSMGQDKGITLNMKNAEATLIFLKIEQQSSYKFFYKTEQIKQLKNISIQVRNAPIKNVLDEIFNGTNFTYETTGEQIVVLEKKIEKIDYRHGKRERHERRNNYRRCYRDQRNHVRRGDRHQRELLHQSGPGQHLTIQILRNEG